MLHLQVVLLGLLVGWLLVGLLDFGGELVVVELHAVAAVGHL